MPLLHSLASRSFYTSSVNFKLSSPPSYSILSPFPNPNPHSQYLPLYPRIRRLLPEPSAVASASSDPNPKPSAKRHRRRPKSDQTPPDAPDGVPCSDGYPTTKPRKPRRGRRSGATAVEDFVRARLKDTFDSIRKQNSEVLEGKQEVLKERSGDEGDEGDSERWDRGEGEELMVVDEDDPDWPLDADVGWGTRASEYFEKHAIKNVVDEGFEIDWESETDEGWVKEINCLEWESFAFHPSPLIVLVFERYRRAALNWELLKELEKAAKVYWSAKDRLPPRTIKIDLNIEKDLAHALNVKECPEILYLKGNTILYRDKDFRTADELVQMIAHFYYNAKRPSWVDASRVASPSLPF